MRSVQKTVKITGPLHRQDFGDFGCFSGDATPGSHDPDREQESVELTEARNSTQVRDIDKFADVLAVMQRQVRGQPATNAIPMKSRSIVGRTTDDISIEFEPIEDVLRVA